MPSMKNSHCSCINSLLFVYPYRRLCLETATLLALRDTIFIQFHTTQHEDIMVVLPSLSVMMFLINNLHSNHNYRWWPFSFSFSDGTLSVPYICLQMKPYLITKSHLYFTNFPSLFYYLVISTADIPYGETLPPTAEVT